MNSVLVSQFELSLKLKLLYPSNDARKYYEYLNCIERWLILNANSTTRREHKAANEKLKQELIEKDIPAQVYKDVIAHGSAHVDHVRNINVSVHIKKGYTFSVHVQYTGPIKKKRLYTEVKLSHHKFNELIRYPKTDLVLLIIRYGSLLSRGQQWATPKAQFDHLYENYGVRYEGFASPLNSGLSDRKDAHFCSLFSTDKTFGSIGNFFEQKLYTEDIQADLKKLKIEDVHNASDNKHWLINPPYIEPIMNRVSDKIIEDICYAMDHNLGVMVAYVIPVWEDFSGYQKILNSPYTRYIQIMDKKKHYYEHQGKRKIVSFRSAIFVLDSYDTEIDYTNIAVPMILK